MHLDRSLIEKIRAGRSLGFELNAADAPIGFAKFGNFDAPYPPPGYLPFSVLAVGNGDTYGFYWPIGKENAPPLVITTMHDSWSMFPVASSFERAVRLIHACGLAEDDVEAVAQDFAIELRDIPSLAYDESVSFFYRSAAALLEIDDASPGVLLAVARAACSTGDLNAAEDYATRATELLPEYADAWEFLAELRQQAGDLPGLIAAALRALSAPFCFGASDRSKLLAAISELPDDASAEPSDPLWTRRKQLTFTDDYYKSTDLQPLIEAVNELLSTGQSIRAVHLFLTVGELMGNIDRFLIREFMAGDAAAFQHRSSLSWKGFRAGLREVHAATKVTSRLDLD